MAKKNVKVVEKKYEIIENDFITIAGREIYRIKALKSFDDVKAGEFGGYIEKEENLSHDGDCWIDQDSMVYGDVHITGNSIIQNSRIISKISNLKVLDTPIRDSEIEMDGKDRSYGKIENASIYNSNIRANVIVMTRLSSVSNSTIGEINGEVIEIRMYEGAVIRKADVDMSVYMGANSSIGHHVFKGETKVTPHDPDYDGEIELNLEPNAKVAGKMVISDRNCVMIFKSITAFKNILGTNVYCTYNTVNDMWFVNDVFVLGRDFTEFVKLNDSLSQYRKAELMSHYQLINTLQSIDDEKKNKKERLAKLIC